MKKFPILAVLVFLPVHGFSKGLEGKWVLKSSLVTYQVTHPLHEAKGKSAEARGKGECSNGPCQFLVAVPVKSFDSGDGDRDLHMLQITRGADHPLVVVKVSFAAKAGEKPSARLKVDADVQFAGNEHLYSQVPLTVEATPSGGFHITGILPLSLKDFDIQPPSLLGVPIKDTVPVSLDMDWERPAAK